MKSGTSTLYPNAAVAESVTIYSEQHSTTLPKHITDYHDWVEKNHPQANYMISNFQGQYQVFLARTIGAKRILEVGVYVGYSALVWAHAVGEKGAVTGLEYSAEYAGIARKAFRDNGVTNVEVIEGDALETLPKLNPSEPYDLIFLDAQKSGYPGYLRSILARSQPGTSSPSETRLLRPGGLIVADNVLRRAIVADDSDNNPHAVAARAGAAAKSEYEGSRDIELLREFNSLLVSSERLETLMVPLYDGMAVARLLD